MKLKEWQQKAYNAWVDNDCIGTVKAVTAAGKTHVALKAIIRNGLQGSMIVVHTTALMLQWRNMLIEHLKIPVEDIGLVGGGHWFYEIDKKYIICVINSVRNKSEITRPLMILDECLRGDTKVLLPDLTTESIENIVKNKSIKEVLSYNCISQIFEPKKIVRYIENDLDSKWWELKLKSSSGLIYKIVCTGNHKMWTNNGYKQVQNLRANDIFKVYELQTKYRCKICNELFNSFFARNGHVAIHSKKKSIKKIKLIKNNNLHKQTISVPKIIFKKKFHCDICDKDIYCWNVGMFTRHKLFHNEEFRKRKADKFRKTIKTSEKRKAANLKLKERTGTKNPMHKSRHPQEFWDKHSNMKKEWFKNRTKRQQEEQIQRFMEAPRFSFCKKATKLERKIMDMKISELLYTAKGRNIKFILLKNCKRKIPDFIVRGQNKVVEVGDIEYWHTKEEIERTISEYNKVGIKCLYLTNIDLEKEQETKLLIEKFIRNHEARIISFGQFNQTKFKSEKKNKIYKKYNLEIEDNHNFLANGILVSNCHHFTNPDAKQNIKIFNRKYNHIMGLSATPENELDNSLLDEKCPIIFDYKAKEAQQAGDIGKFNLINVAIKLTDKEQFTHSHNQYIIKNLFHKFNYDFRRMQNSFRFDPDAVILQRAFNKRREVLLKAENKIIKTFETLQNHYKDRPKTIIFNEFNDVVDIIHAELTRRGFTAVKYHSGIKKKDREQSLKDFRENKANIMVVSKCLDEGLDIPTISLGIIVGGSSVRRQTIQRLGRLLRTKKGKIATLYSFYIKDTVDEKWNIKRISYIKDLASTIINR